MKSLELRWGLLIGIANLVWLYGTFYAGLHTRGVAGIQVVTLGAFLLSLIGYVFALRAVVRREPETSYLEGLKSGAVVAGVVALVAMIAQVGYFKVVNPDWTEYMVGETRKFFEARGLPEEGIAEQVEGARKTFGLGSYVIQSALGAVFLGVLFSSIIMIFLRKRRA